MDRAENTHRKTLSMDRAKKHSEKHTMDYGWIERKNTQENTFFSRKIHRGKHTHTHTHTQNSLTHTHTHTELSLSLTHTHTVHAHKCA
jgi:hypothetical protein